jgi:hypothetical protein
LYFYTNFFKKLSLAVEVQKNAEGTPRGYQRALAQGDLEGIVGTFEPDGCAREQRTAEYGEDLLM